MKETVGFQRDSLDNLLTEEADIAKMQSNEFFFSVFTQKTGGQMSATDINFPGEPVKNIQGR